MKRSTSRIHTHSAFPAFVLAAASLGLAIYFNPGLLSPMGRVGWSTSQLGLWAAVLAQALILIGRGIDLSIGAAVSLVNVVAIKLFGMGLTLPLVLVLAILTGGVIGVANGILIAYLRINPLLATFAMSFVLLGTSLQLLPAPGGMAPIDAVIFANKASIGIPHAIFALILLIVAWQLIAGSSFMTRLRAVGSDPERAFNSGIAVQKTSLISYVLAGLLTGVSGVVVTLTIGAGDPLIGQSYTLLTIAGAVIGGVALMGGSGSGIGALMGVMFVGIIGDLALGTGISPFYQQAIVGGVLLAGLAGVVTLRRWIETTEHRRISRSLRAAKQGAAS